ncbi:site-specific integrase [Ureibacillus aquaedulcis]|uniref:Site-specific integrase n=1 Tax=Ureibacillus aquaedulcis TaxID=3058421 RepID=A0ABT8GNV2_9BACL|nr:site-specific integrase [Ureibacillus sp. BA0131]MDN4493100.1 site-specific integrase [Ureibacillus sp. BA0131]
MSKQTSIKSYKLKNNETRYMFQIYIGVDPLTGKEQSTTRRGFKTKKEAKDALVALKVEIKNGTFKKRAIETYQDLYDIWVNDYENTVQDSTFLKTTRIFNNHILPTMGNYKIDKIDVETCQKHVNQWAKELKRFNMVKAYAAKVLKFAMKRGYIQINPFDLVEIPIVKKQVSLEEDEEDDGNFYTREQLVELLNSFEQEGNLKRYAFFHLLSFSGMRKSEAFALMWKDINFVNNEIRITKAVARGKQGLYLGPTKNGLPRTIKLDNTTMQLLKDWKKQQAKKHLQLGLNTMQKNQLVFPSTKNALHEPNKTYRWLKHVLEKYKLEAITTHGLRHTHCSLLFEAGATIKEVQYRLGHKDVKTTLEVYTHVTKKAKAETIDKFEKYLTE